MLKYAQEDLVELFQNGVDENSIKKLEEMLKQNNIPQNTIDSITKSLKESNPQMEDQTQVEPAPQAPSTEDTTYQTLQPGKGLKPNNKIGTIKINAEDFLDDLFEEEVEEQLNKGTPVDVARKSALDRLSFVQKYLAIWAEPAPIETVVQPGLAESATEEDEEDKKKKRKKKKKH